MSTAAGSQDAAPRLLHAAEKRSTLIYWPESVDEHLNELQQLIMATGAHASRAQILAALVMAAPQDGEHLAGLVHSYRRLGTTGLTTPRPPKAAPRRPGPRQAVGRSPAEPRGQK
jgi:hypothetical protein